MQSENFQLPTSADSGQLYSPKTFFSSTKKKCHAGRFDDSYRRHSAFDSLSLSFFEMNTRVRKCLDALTMLGHVNFYAGIYRLVRRWYCWLRPSRWASIRILLFYSSFDDSKIILILMSRTRFRTRMAENFLAEPFFKKFIILLHAFWRALIYSYCSFTVDSNFIWCLLLPTRSSSNHALNVFSPSVDSRRWHEKERHVLG